MATLLFDPSRAHQARLFCQCLTANKDLQNVVKCAECEGGPLKLVTMAQEIPHHNAFHKWTVPEIQSICSMFTGEEDFTCQPQAGCWNGEDSEESVVRGGGKAIE